MTSKKQCGSGIKVANLEPKMLLIDRKALSYINLEGH